MRVVLDTNVLLAAFVARGMCHELFEHVARAHELIASEHILAEFRRGLTRKLKLPAADAAEADELLRMRATVVVPAAVAAPQCRDPGDVPILGTAVAGKCACLITGDGDLLALRKFQEIPILVPSAFWHFEHHRTAR
jgi:putative PIN family toxin of toxin-antitoxin system